MLNWRIEYPSASSRLRASRDPSRPARPSLFFQNRIRIMGWLLPGACFWFMACAGESERAGPDGAPTVTTGLGSALGTRCQWPSKIAHFWPLKIAHIAGAPVKGAERPPRLPRPDLVPSCLPPSRSGFPLTARAAVGWIALEIRGGAAGSCCPGWTMWHPGCGPEALPPFVSQDLAPFLEALVRGQHRRGPLVAPVHQLEKQNRSALADRVADLIHHQERRIGQGLETPTPRLRFLQGVDEVHQRP